MNHAALITGSYGGLGTALTNIHASRGGDLILVGRSQAKLDAQAEQVRSTYRVEVHTIAVDLSTPEAAQTIFDTCQDNGWTPDIIINNAGFGGQGDFARERTMEQDMSMIAVNIETPTRLLKLFLPGMIERGAGKVLNVSSTAARLPGPLQAVYYATKAYMTSWSNALWRELKGTGVTVTALMPGAMSTGFIAAGGRYPDVPQCCGPRGRREGRLRGHAHRQAKRHRGPAQLAGSTHGRRPDSASQADA